MNKNDLVNALVERVGLSKADAAAAVDAVFNEIEQAVNSGDMVKIRGFGSFAAVRRKARNGYNIHTKKVVRIPEKNIPKFNPGKNLITSAKKAEVQYYEDGSRIHPEVVKAKKKVEKPAPEAPKKAAATETAPEPDFGIDQEFGVAPPPDKAAPKPEARGLDLGDLINDETLAEPEPKKKKKKPVAKEAPPAEDFSNDPGHKKAVRVVRSFLSDLLLYQEDKVEKSRKEGNFRKAFRKEIENMKDTYEQRIPEYVRNQRDYLNEMLDEFAEAKD